MFELSIAGLIDSAVNSKSLAALDMALGSIKMRVSGHDVALFYKSAEKHVFGSAALMCGHYQRKTGDAFDCVLHLEERTCAGIALVAGHHGCPLAVAHGAGT